MQQSGTPLNAKVLYFLSLMTDNTDHGNSGLSCDKPPPEAVVAAWKEESEDDDWVPE
jgi:hypothetical protein